VSDKRRHPQYSAGPHKGPATVRAAQLSSKRYAATRAAATAALPHGR